MQRSQIGVNIFVLAILRNSGDCLRLRICSLVTRVAVYDVLDQRTHAPDT